MYVRIHREAAAAHGIGNMFRADGQHGSVPGDGQGRQWVFVCMYVWVCVSVCVFLLHYATIECNAIYANVHDFSDI